MNTPSITTPPCLVLAIGSQAELTALDAQTLYLRGNPWRSSTARFLGMRFTQAKDAVCAGWTPLKTVRTQRASSATRQQIYTAVLNSAPEFRSALETALHELRAHEQIVLAGYGEKRIFTIQVLILADLTQPESAALFPLVALLGDLLAREADAQILLMLNVSRFSNGKDQKGMRLKNACCHAGLQDMQAFFAPRRNVFQEKLARDLELQASASQPDSCVFLFDRYKEGGWEVKDENELRILSANFLLALLTGGLAARMEPLSYHSAAATALVYDPLNLIEACAARSGLEFLEREFGEQVAPGYHVVQQVTNELSAMYADLRSWLEMMTSGTDFCARAEAFPGLETHFADLSFDDLPLEEWSLAIQGYGTHFEQVQFLANLEKLKANTQALAERLSLEQSEMLDTLPRQGRLYPGGLLASRIIIAELRNLLVARREQFPIRDGEFFSQDRLALPVNSSLQLLDSAVDALPQPPRWFSFLPFSFGRLAKHLFVFLTQRKEQARLIQLRQQAVLALETKYAAMLEENARQMLAELGQRLSGELDAIDQAIQAFQGEVKKACAKLEHRSDQGVETSIFRPCAVDKAVLNWACDEFKKSVDEIRFMLFDEHDFLYYWRDMDGRDLLSGVLTFTRSMYQPLWNFNLDQILSHRAENDLALLWTTLSQGTLPLLRPDFDTCPANSAEVPGGNGQTFQTQYFLCASARNTAFAAFLHEPLATWNLLATGDPTLAMCVRLRHMIPLTALGQLWERGQLDFDNLSQSENNGLRLFAANAQPPEAEQ